MVDIRELLFNETMKNTLKDITNLESEDDCASKKENNCKSDSPDNIKYKVESEFDVHEVQAKLKNYRFSSESVNNSSYKVQYSNIPNVHSFIAFANKAGQHFCAHKNKMDPSIYRDYFNARPKISVQQVSKKSNQGTENATSIIVGGKSDYCESSKILTNFNYYTRNPLLHYWEKDEDRPGGGSWSQRKQLYNHISDKFSKSELFSLAGGESHKENALNPSKRRKVDSNGVDSAVSESLVIDDHRSALLNTFRPELSGYRWSDDGDEELLLFWR